MKGLLTITICIALAWLLAAIGVWLNICKRDFTVTGMIVILCLIGIAWDLTCSKSSDNQETTGR